MRSSLSRRAFSSLILGSLWGCDEAPHEVKPAGAPHVPPAELPLVAVSASALPASFVLPLFRSYPALAARISRLPLGEFPTPVEHAEKLGRKIGVPNLYIKRDDLAGSLYGGGKTRKLEFYLAEAKARGATEVLTFGAYGSNQAVATALWGRAQGFGVRLLLAPQMPSEYVQKNLFAMRRAGAVIEVVRDGVGAAETRAKEKIERSKGPVPYLIPPGGSSPLGNLAFVNAALELAEQVRAGVCPLPDCIYLAMGTAGSAVGLALGLELLGLPTEVVAVRASSPETSSSARFHTLAKETVDYARSLDPGFPALRLGLQRVRIQAHQLGGGYGFSTRSGAAAMQVFEELQGYTLEPTYTAKALAALIAEEKQLANKNVLFWNSHNTRSLAIDGVGPHDFPQDLRDYLKRSH